MDRFGSGEVVALIVLVWIVGIVVGAVLITKKIKSKKARRLAP